MNAVKVISLIFLLSHIVLAVKIGDFEYSDEEIAGIHADLKDWSALAQKAKNAPSGDLIPLIGRGLSKTSSGSIYVVGDRLAVYRELQTALAGIPGHAKYYDTRIREAQARYKKEILKDPLSPDTGIKLGAYRNELLYGGKVLENLPTTENVSVLGEMLSDRWVPQNVDPTLQGPTLAGFSVQALHALPLRDKPTAHWMHITTGNIDEAMTLWQKWYQQVKEGRRTFSFEGDPNEYSLTGPVGTAKNPDVPRVVKRPVTTGAEEASPRSRSKTHVPLLLWMAAIIAALAGGTYFLMGKSRVS